MLQKNIITLLLITLCHVAQAQLSGDTFRKAKQTKTANVVYNYLPLSVYVQETNDNIDGITTDIMKEFEKYVYSKYQIKIKAKYVSVGAGYYKKLFSNMSNSSGGVFGLAPMIITPDRKKNFSISAPYLVNIQLIISSKTVPTLSKLNNIATEFEGKTAITIKNSSNSKAISELKKKYYPELKIEYVSSYAEIVNQVLADANNFAFINFAAYLGDKRALNSIKIHISASRTSEHFGIIMPKGSDWEPILSEFINSGFVGSPTYNSIIRRYLGDKSVRLIEGFQ